MFAAFRLWKQAPRSVYPLIRSIICLGVSGHVYELMLCCYMFNKICVKDEYLIKVSFLKYSGLLDYLVYLFFSGVYSLEVYRDNYLHAYISGSSCCK
jgi:hypothetical protein